MTFTDGFLDPPGGGAAASALAASAIAEPRTCFVFQPGGTAGQNVYTSWAALVTALGFVSGCKRIQFDNSFSAIAIPAGGPYDMTDTEWFVPQNEPFGATMTITVTEGATFTGLRTFTGPMSVVNAATATIPNTDLGNGDLITIQDQADITSTGGIAFFAGSGLVSGDLIIVIWTESGSLGFSGSGTVIDLPVAGTTAFAFLGRGSGPNPDTLGAAVGAVWSLNISSTSAFFGRSQVGILGLLLFQISDRWQLDQPAVKTSAGTIFNNDYNRADVSGGAFALTLESVSGAFASTRGKWMVVRETSGTVGLTLVPSGGDTVNGGAGPLAVPAGGSVLLQSDGVSNWESVIIHDPLSIGATVFGQDYQSVAATARSTTTSSTFQTKATLVAPALTGTYRVAWMAVIDNGGTEGEFRLENITDAATVAGTIAEKSGDSVNEIFVGGFAEVVFTGSAKTFEIQFRDVAGGNLQGIAEARIEFWRVS